MVTILKRFIALIVFAGIVLIGAGVYIVVNHVGMATRMSSGAEPANLWLGIWQGFIICLSFIASWFDNNIVLYQVNNNGFWYNLGFIIGIAIPIGSGGAGGSKGRKSKNETCC